MLLCFATRSTHAQQVLWGDEFNQSNGPNSDIWTYDTGRGGNGELQEYTRANVDEESGRLSITAKREKSLWDFFVGNSKLTSGRIVSKSNLQVLYGRIEATIEVPNPSNGLWPSLYLLGANIDDVGWPESGSMALMQVGSAKALQQGQAKTRVDSSLFWENNNNGEVESHSDSINTVDLTEGYHTYAMDWTPDSITTYVDGNQIMSKDISSAGCPTCLAFHKPFFLSLSLAVGGSYTGINDESDVTASLPAEMLVDYIRIYDNGFTQVSGSGYSAPPPVSTTVSSTEYSTTSSTTSTVLSTTALASTIDGTTGTSTTSVPPDEETSTPTLAPTSQTTTESPTDSIHTAEALGMIMSLTNIKPLDSVAQDNWVEATEGHLIDEAIKSTGLSEVKVKVKIASQNPPYCTPKRFLRRLQTNQQEITFNAVYSMQSPSQVDDATPFVMDAFSTNGQKAIYLERLMDSGNVAFQNATFVSVKSSNVDGAQESNPGGNATNVGLIVGAAMASLVVLVLGLALYMRRRRTDPSTVVTKSTHDLEMGTPEEPKMDQSGTIGEDSLYTGHPSKLKVAPNDNVSSLASSYRSEDESYGDFSSELSTLDVDYMNRDAYWNKEKSLISGDGDDSSVAVEETLLCIEYTVQAPKGKLGLTLQTSDEGCPTVCKIQPTSPLNGKVRVGDRLHSVDGRDVTMVLSDTVARIIASRENHENRTLVFGRPKR